MGRFRSIRSYLIILLVAATAPLLLLQILFLDQQIDRDLTVAGNTANNLAGIGAGNLSRFLSDARRVLANLAERPRIRSLSFEDPDPPLRDFLQLHDHFTNAVVVDRSGHILFSALPVNPPGSLRVDEMQWFGEVNRTQDFTVGDPRVGPITKRWVSVLAYPVRGQNGKMIAALALPVDLLRLESLFQQVLPEGSVLTVLDRSGRVISRSSEAEQWLGYQVDTEWLSDMSQIPGQGLRTGGIDGVERIYGRATVTGAGWRLYLGIPTEIALAPGRRTLQRSLLLASLAVFLAASLAVAVSRRISRPIDALADYCRGEGSHQQLPRLHSGPAEIREMASAFGQLLERRRDHVQTLEESRAWLGLAVRSARIGLWERNLQDGRVRYSREWKAQLGYSEDEIADQLQEFDQRLHPDDRARLQQAVDEVLTESSISWARDEFRLLHRDGTYRWFLSQATVVRDDRASPVRLLGAQIDITERKLFEQELQKSAQRFKAVVRATNDAIWDWDIARDEITWHDESQMLFGYPKASSVWKSTHWYGRIHPRDRRRVKTAIDELIAGSTSSWSDEYRLEVNPSSYLYIYDRAYVLRDAQGFALRIIGAKQDVTARKNTEAALFKAKGRLEKLSSSILRTQETERRRIARELHDEVGQTLTATKINLEALLRFPDPVVLARRLRDSIGLVEEAIETIRNLSLSLRPPMLDDLGLRPSLQWLTRQVSKRNDLEIELLLPSTLTHVDPEVETACFRVAQEALTNISRHAGASKVVVGLGAEAGVLTLSVQDDGIGFDVESKLALAEQGKSFGLLGMEERTSLVGGSVSWKSRPSRGTEVVARFPVSEGDDTALHLGGAL